MWYTKRVINKNRKGGESMDYKKTGDILMWVSVAAAVVAGFVSLSQVNLFKLAGTQWMLIAIILGVYGTYVKMLTNKTNK